MTPEAGDTPGSHHHDEIGVAWAETGKTKRTVRKRGRSRSGEEAVLVSMLPEHLWCKTLIEPCNKCLLFLLHLCHLAKWVCGNMKFREVDIAPSVDSPSGSHSVLPAGFFPIAAPRQCHCTTQWDQQQDRIAELQRADLERALLPENVLEIVIRNKQPPSCANHSQICPLGTGHTNRMLGAMKYQFVNPWHIFPNKKKT